MSRYPACATMSRVVRIAARSSAESTPCATASTSGRSRSAASRITAIEAASYVAEPSWKPPRSDTTTRAVRAPIDSSSARMFATS